MSYEDAALAAWADDDPPPGVLLTFPHYASADVASVTGRVRQIGCPVFADSGAFTQWRTGTRINLDEYCRWLDRWQDVFTVYANLDVIGSAPQTERNYWAMVERGYAPLYVVSPATPTDDVGDAPPGPVALGGLDRVGRDKVNVARWIRWAADTVGHRPHLHAFGVTDLPLITNAPHITSADSTTWMAGFKYGALSLWRPRLGRLVQHRRHVIDRSPQIQHDIQRLGYTWRAVDRAMANRDGRVLAEVALASIRAAQQEMSAHMKRPFTIYAAAVL